MIIFNDLTWLTRSDMPSEDWTGKAKYVLPDGSELANKIISAKYGFEIIEEKDGSIIDIQPLNAPIEIIRNAKLAEINAACTSTIEAGVEYNGKRFGLKIHDQINLMALASMAEKDGLPKPYHADGELCQVFPAADIIEIAGLATATIAYQTTYYNFLKKYVMGLQTVEELSQVMYGKRLPEELERALNEVLGVPPSET